MNKSAFTMIELVFVIVILGILSAIAIPRLTLTRENAQISSAKADIASIRSAIISERQSRLIIGQNTWISALSDNNTTLFTGNGTRALLMYGIVSENVDGWSAVDTDYLDYAYTVSGVSVTFNYTSGNGMFTCDRDDATSGAMCKELTD